MLRLFRRIGYYWTLRKWNSPHAEAWRIAGSWAGYEERKWKTRGKP